MGGREDERWEGIDYAKVRGRREGAILVVVVVIGLGFMVWTVLYQFMHLDL